MTNIPAGQARAAVDTARIASALGDQARAFLDQTETWPSTMQPQGGTSFRAIHVWLFRQEMRSLLDFAQRLEPIVVNAMASREHLDFDLSLRHVGASASPAESTRGLSLVSLIPDDAILAVDSGLGGRQGHLFIDGTMRYLDRLLFGVDAAANASTRSMANTLFTLVFYDFRQTTVGQQAPGLEWTDQEIAFALCPAGDHPLRFGRVLLMRPQAEDYNDLVESLLANWTPSETVSEIGGPVRRDYAGSIDIAGHEVHHFRMTGAGLHVQRSVEERAQAFESPLQALFGPIGDVDAWFSHRDGVIILTTEPEPELMRRILTGERGMSPQPTGDIAMRISVGRILEWMSTIAARAGGRPETAQMFAEISRTALEKEQGIWIRIDTLPGGFDAHLTFPATDAAALVSLLEQ